MASTTSSSVNPAACGARLVFIVFLPDLLLVDAHGESLEGVGLAAAAVLPVDVHLDVAGQLVLLDLGVVRRSGNLVGHLGRSHHDVRAEAFRGRALGLELLRRVEDDLVHLGAGAHHGARLPRRPPLQLQAAAEDLHARHHPDPDDGQRDGDLEQREAAGAGARVHDVASSTRTLPTSGSRLMRSRSRVRSRRLATTTSTPLVLPFGKNRICRPPSPTSAPPSTRSMTARSVRIAQRPQSLVAMELRSGLMISSCGSDLESASTRQWTMVDAICRAARRTSRESKPPSMRGTASVSPMAMITRTTAISMSVKPRGADRLTRCHLPSWRCRGSGPARRGRRRHPPSGCRRAPGLLRDCVPL